MTNDRLTTGLRALGEPKRLEILRRVAELEKAGEVTCSSLLSDLGVSQSTLSHHISALVSAGLLQSECKGKFLLLRVDQEAMHELSELLGKLTD